MADHIKIKESKILSHAWGILNEINYDYEYEKTKWKNITRESYNTGDGATVLLYNRKSKKVILTRQFRLPTYLNGNKGGMLIETCAGLLDKDSPENCVIKEAEEETGYIITKPEKVFEAYSSPGSLTEIMYYYIAEYSNEKKVGEGGGLNEEKEFIDVLEYSFEDAYKMIFSGEIKDSKTILLLQHLKIKNFF